jgi:hypothetical protein
LGICHVSIKNSQELVEFRLAGFMSFESAFIG